MKHFNILVTGKVQGVFFRALTKEKADELGIAGFVRNLPDGSVYAEAEGSDQQLENFIRWCRVGPPRARVEKISTQEAEIKGYTKFDVVR